MHIASRIDLNVTPVAKGWIVNKKETIWDGKTYDSRKAAARDNGISYDRLRYWYRQGVTSDKEIYQIQYGTRISIREDWQRGKDYRWLSTKYGYSISTIRCIVHGYGKYNE